MIVLSHQLNRKLHTTYRYKIVNVSVFYKIGQYAVSFFGKLQLFADIFQELWNLESKSAVIYYSSRHTNIL